MKRMTEKQRKRMGTLVLLAVVLFFALLTALLWEPFRQFFGDPEKFRTWVEEKGWGARGIFVGTVVLQVIVALIPGEPLEIAAGYAFGSVEGTVLTLAGIAIGSTLVFLFVRIFGICLVQVFFPLEKIHSLRLLQNSKRFHTILFIIMFIPGTPKDLISYFVGLTEMKLGHWILLTSVARIPSVVTSTVGGNALGEEKYLFAALVFAVTVAVSLLGFFVYNRITKRRQQKINDNDSPKGES